MAGLDDSRLVQLALLLIAVGALAGFPAGLFGIGGGAILVPVFYECFGAIGYVYAGWPAADRYPDVSALQ